MDNEKLIKGLATQLWGNAVTADAMENAKQIAPFVQELLEKTAKSARYEGYQSGAASERKKAHEALSNNSEPRSPKGTDATLAVDKDIEAAINLAVAEWTLQGRTEEQRYVMTNFLTGRGAQLTSALSQLFEKKLVGELESILSLTDSYDGKVQLLASMVEAIRTRIDEIKADRINQLRSK